MEREDQVGNPAKYLGWATRKRNKNTKGFKLQHAPIYQKRRIGKPKTQKRS